MKVIELIEELKKLPPDVDITFEDYDGEFDAKIHWDITEEEYKEGYTDEPYIYLERTRRFG